jgi:hypothetical protein
VLSTKRVSSIVFVVAEHNAVALGWRAFKRIYCLVVVAEHITVTLGWRAFYQGMGTKLSQTVLTKGTIGSTL